MVRDHGPPHPRAVLYGMGRSQSSILAPGSLLGPYSGQWERPPESCRLSGPPLNPAASRLELEHQTPPLTLAASVGTVGHSKAQYMGQGVICFNTFISNPVTSQSASWSNDFLHLALGRALVLPSLELAAV